MKKNLLKKLISMLLATAMMFTIMPISAFAQIAGGKNNNTGLYVWLTEAVLRELGVGMEDADFYRSDVTQSAYALGISETQNGTIYWYDRSCLRVFMNEGHTFTFFTDTHQLKDNWTGKVYSYIGTTNKPSETSDSSSDGGSGAILVGVVAIGALIAGGAIVGVIANIQNSRIADLCYNVNDITYMIPTGEFGLATFHKTVADTTKEKIEKLADRKKIDYLKVNCSEMKKPMEICIKLNTQWRKDFKVYAIDDEGKAIKLRARSSYPEKESDRIDGSYYIHGDELYIYTSKSAQYGIGYNYNSAG